MKRLALVFVLLVPSVLLAQSLQHGVGAFAQAPVASAQVSNASGAASVTALPAATDTSSLQQQVAQLQQVVAGLKGLLEIQGNQLQQLQLQMQSLQQGRSPQSNSNAVMPAPTAAHSTTSHPATKQGGEHAVYESAYALVQNKQYQQATQAMQAYLKKYPSGQYTVNAHYWLGELYAISGDQKKALNEFNTVVSQYPQSNKAPDAMLKLGMIAYGENQYAQAKVWFSQINSKYANSSAARVASQELLQLQQAGY